MVCDCTIFKDKSKINQYCKVAVTNITGPQANYLDQGHWTISVPKPTHMEIKCEDHTQVKTLQPPSHLLTFSLLAVLFHLKLSCLLILNNIPRASMLH